MKFKPKTLNSKYRTFALLALAGMAFVIPTGAKAQSFAFSNESYFQSGDLFLQVSDSADSVTDSYAVDIGNASEFTTTASLTLGNYSTDLNAIFGPTSNSASPWNQSGAIWTVDGSNAAPEGGSGSDYYQGVSSSSSSTVISQFDSSSTIHRNQTFSGLGTAFAGGVATSGFTTGTPAATALQAVIATASPTAGPESDNLSVNGQNYSVVSGFTASGAATLELVDFNKTTDTATDLGTFDFSSTGELSYVGIDATAAPEPSTYALLAGGLGFLFWKLRRRTPGFAV